MNAIAELCISYRFQDAAPALFLARLSKRVKPLEEVIMPRAYAGLS